jgi:hypothetical protein
MPCFFLIKYIYGKYFNRGDMDMQLNIRERLTQPGQFLTLPSQGSAGKPDTESKDAKFPDNHYSGYLHAHYYASEGGDDGGKTLVEFTPNKRYRLPEFLHNVIFDERVEPCKLGRSPENTAEKAFQTAKENGCDFYSLTPHTGKVSQDEFDDLIDDTNHFNEEHGENFAAIYGQEFGNDMNEGNHMNIFNSDVLCDVEDGRHDKLYEEWLPSRSDDVTIQYNHPYLGSPRNDLGFDDYGFDMGKVVEASDDYTNTVSIVTAPKHTEKGYKIHNDANCFKYYTGMLNDGFHVAPIADEDHHVDEWGGKIAARTVVIADELTPESILEAVRERRVYATEDDELRIDYKASGESFDEQMMGARVNCEDGEEVTFSVNLDQVKGVDGDPIDEGDYTVTLWGHEGGIGSGHAYPIEAKAAKREPTGITGQVRGDVEEVTFKRNVEKGQYYLIHVEEADGKDNGGNNDDAYTAPIWFE